MTHTRGVEILAEHIGVDVQHVARAFHYVSRTHTAIRATHYRHLTDDQFRRLIGTDRFPVVIVANIAMRFAGRPEDAQLLMDIFKASEDATAHRLHVRRGVGTLPEYHDHPHVQQAIRILQAADLPPIVTDGTRELRPGFQVMPGCDDFPGWVFINPDPACQERTGFAGGRLGYLAVLRFAGWGVITEPVADGLWAAVHPNYRSNPFPS
ncbi:hypothetical protein [Streptantibioticus ferralitis]|uniref:Uncharacterized protein n=1 Tax=Streptantibioticus ferralitis TaxID=236510 RepID=A0ABT5YZZ2_9ACTN|nr:hypothetical protein [Streptantibioticus ferralitis]MDF2257157.1 hypothetical protein [Streptantibioticus ferralitis]